MKNNPKYLLMDFYLNLLALPIDSKFRLYNQNLYAYIRDILAEQLSTDPETIQNIFERMAKEDA